MAGLLYFTQQVGGDEDGPALGDQARDQAAQFKDAARVETVHRLVEDNPLRVGQQAAGDAEPLAHPLRVAAHPVVAAVGQPDPVERGLNLTTGAELAPASAQATAARRPGAALSARETEVARSIARGRTNSEIRAGLFISLSTVKSHLASIQDKLGARNRAEIAAWAWETVSPRWTAGNEKPQGGPEGHTLGRLELPRPARCRGVTSGTGSC
jgi:DNA-binding CsgD family transcriptional regulator